MYMHLWTIVSACLSRLQQPTYCGSKERDRRIARFNEYYEVFVFERYKSSNLEPSNKSRFSMQLMQLEHSKITRNPTTIVSICSSQQEAVYPGFKVWFDHNFWEKEQANDIVLRWHKIMYM